MGDELKRMQELVNKFPTSYAKTSYKPIDHGDNSELSDDFALDDDKKRGEEEKRKKYRGIRSSVGEEEKKENI